MLAIAVPPLSGYWAVTRTLDGKVSPLKAFIVNLAISGLPVFMFWAVHAIWLEIARNAGRLAFEADTAMGIAIEYLFCLLLFLIVNIPVGCFLLGLTFLRRRKTRE